MMTGWSRKSYVTGGADPTQVVEWTKGEVTITEFQGIYEVNAKTHRTLNLLAEELHKELEAEHDREEDARAAAAAEYGDPDCHIYGEA